METEHKSPNRIWRESGTSLNFADWIQREKDKGSFLINKQFEKYVNFNDEVSVRSLLDEEKEKARQELKVKENEKEDNSFVGLNKTVLLISALIIIAGIGYKFYQKRK